MIRALVSKLVASLCRSKPAPVPFLLDVKITRLRSAVRRGGQGSDLAAAELRGITETIMALAR